MSIMSLLTHLGAVITIASATTAQTTLPPAARKLASDNSIKDVQVVGTRLRFAYPIEKLSKEACARTWVPSLRMCEIPLNLPPQLKDPTVINQGGYLKAKEEIAMSVLNEKSLKDYLPQWNGYYGVTWSGFYPSYFYKMENVVVTIQAFADRIDLGVNVPKNTKFEDLGDISGVIADYKSMLKVQLEATVNE